VQRTDCRLLIKPPAEIQRVAVIQPNIIDESLDQDFGGILRQASNKRTQMPELVIASTTHS